MKDALYRLTLTTLLLGTIGPATYALTESDKITAWDAAVLYR